MYQIITKGTEYEIFDKNVIDGIFVTIAKEITELLQKTTNPKPAIIGALAFENVPLKKGGTTNVYIEYNAMVVVPAGTSLAVVDAGVNECIIYDEIPDIVLDKYNDLKTVAF